MDMDNRYFNTLVYNRCKKQNLSAKATLNFEKIWEKFSRKNKFSGIKSELFKILSWNSVARG